VSLDFFNAFPPAESKKFDTGVPIPKFVRLLSLLRTNLGFDKDTSKLMILMWFRV
jgi:hypothetical protein